MAAAAVDVLPNVEPSAGVDELLPDPLDLPSVPDELQKSLNELLPAQG